MNNMFKTGLLALALVVGASSMVQPAQAGLSDIFTTIRAYIPALTFKRVGIVAGVAVAAACLGAYLFYQGTQKVGAAPENNYIPLSTTAVHDHLQKIPNKEQVVIEKINVRGKEVEDLYAALLSDRRVDSALKDGVFTGKVTGDAKTMVEAALPDLLVENCIVVRGYLMNSYKHTISFSKTNNKNVLKLIVLRMPKK